MRSCDRTVSSARLKPVYTAGDLYSQNWVGWEANQGHSSINYSETDVDYYEPCPDNSQDSEEAMWAGLGGETTQYLVQTGTIVHRYWTGSNWYNDHEAYVENVGDTGNYDTPQKLDSPIR